ncbi:MAG: DEAD/DEAH box helicase family protein [Planctomycetota bacterium]
MTNFAFLQAEWPDLSEAGQRAESSIQSDPRAACFHARRGLELAVDWLYRHDRTLKKPYSDNLGALLHEPTFKDLLKPTIFAKARLIVSVGNAAVHGGRPVKPVDALTAVKELFHVGYWLARNYARTAKPPSPLAYDPAQAARAAIAPQTQIHLQKLAADLEAERQARLSAEEARQSVDAELARLREEVAKAKAINEARPDDHDYSETETRDFFIDLLLKEAGWPLDQARDREFPVEGMPNYQGKGFVDYVLWGADNLPLAVVEAKRTRRDADQGRQQAKLYADCLEKAYGRRPLIFYTNGYEHWIWDDVHYPPRPIQGFLKRDELELAIQRRSSRKSLAEAKINEVIVERYYQWRAIRRIGESFERERQRKALVVMATGAGKTRTVIALADLLMRCNWAKRVLFLADRVALVRQAARAFKIHLPDVPPVNLIEDRYGEGRVFVSTYPTMMGLIDERREGERRFGPGHFDLIVIDEAHRSVFRKYKAIFDYFDSLLVGLTATPREEVERSTYRLFDLENGVPTDAYPLEEAVRDGFLVPMRAVSVPLRFQREGIRYDDLSPEEREAWDEIEWEEGGGERDRVEADELNKWLFNADTVDKVLEHLMTRGQKVAGGDRLAKTIVFAKNHNHAAFIAARFDANYPHLKGAFARVIDFQTDYAQSLIDDFSKPASAPHIAISVDMLDTGIDVPEVANLVFFKLVRSRTKFWQMIGRGTRLSPDLFGPGQHKEFFYVFDFCQNLEYFSQNPQTVDGAVGMTLSQRLFVGRLELIRALDGTPPPNKPKGLGESAGDFEGPDALRAIREELAAMLRGEVTAMNPDNFMVRARRRLVEKYREADAWKTLGEEAVAELARDVSGLPSERPAEDEEAKRFDLLILSLQLCILRADAGFDPLRDKVREIASLLEDQSSIPAIRAQLDLIQAIQTDDWWQDVTLPMLESARKALRLLVKLIERRKRKIVYTDFEDQIGDGRAIELPGFAGGDGFERFKQKARAFLKEHEDHVAVAKLRLNRPLTLSDLAELERILVESGTANPENLNRVREQAEGLGLFVRSLVGLDRAAATEAFGEFLNDRTLGANQIEFVKLIVDHLTENGTMDAARLYESPFTDLHTQGVTGLFPEAKVERLVDILKTVHDRAVA